MYFTPKFMFLYRKTGIKLTIISNSQTYQVTLFINLEFIMVNRVKIKIY